MEQDDASEKSIHHIILDHILTHHGGTWGHLSHHAIAVSRRAKEADAEVEAAEKMQSDLLESMQDPRYSGQSLPEEMIKQVSACATRLGIAHANAAELAGFRQQMMTDRLAFIRQITEDGSFGELKDEVTQAHGRMGDTELEVAIHAVIAKEMESLEKTATHPDACVLGDVSKMPFDGWQGHVASGSTSRRYMN